MKNLLVLNNLTEDQASNYISYINKSGYELEIITAEGYSDLDRVIYLKQSKQLNSIQEYKYCFYLDNQQELIDLPNNFIAVVLISGTTPGSEFIKAKGSTVIPLNDGSNLSLPVKLF